MQDFTDLSSKSIKDIDLEEIKALIQNANFSFDDFANFLMKAIGNEDLEVVKFLTKLKFNINFEVIHGDGTPLNYAVAKENISIVVELIKVGADPNYVLRWDENDMPLYIAASVGNLDLVKLLIRAGADVNHVWLGNYALEAATVAGHEEVYKYLYPLTNDDLREDTKEYLLLAIREKHIEKSSDPNIVELNTAIFNDNLCEFESILARGVNINAYDSSGDTPLIKASLKANPIIVRQLLAAGANPNAKNYDNETPLMRVVGEFPYRVEVCRELIQAGADLNTQDNDGKTALINAANIGSSSCVKLLLDMGAIKSIKDNDGKIAFDYASLHSQEDYFWAANVDYQTVINLLEQ
jgi:uncharacterized protein